MFLILELLFIEIYPIYDIYGKTLKTAGSCKQKKPRPRPGPVPVAEVCLLLKWLKNYS